MRRKIAIGRLSFSRRGEVEVFGTKVRMLSTPHLPPSLGYGAAGNPLSRSVLATALCRRPVNFIGERLGRARRLHRDSIAAVLALGGIRRLIVLSVVKAFGVKE